MTIEQLTADLTGTDREARLKAIAELRRLGTPAAAAGLARVLTDPDDEICRLAVEALVTFGMVAGEPVVSALSDHPDSLRPPVIELLSRFRNQAALGILLRLSTDSDPEVRAALARVLGRTGASSVLEPLTELLRDLDARVRIAAATALGEIGDEQAVIPLLDELNDDSPELRIAVAEALGSIGNREASDVLVDLSSNDPEPRVRSAAEASLRGITGRAIEPLVAMLGDDDPARRIQAMAGLLERGRAVVVPLVDLVQQDDAEHPERTRPGVREAAVELLGSIGGPAALDVLETIINDPDVRVRKACAVSLGRIHNKRSGGLLARMLDNDDAVTADAAADSLISMGEPAIEPVAARLDSQSNDTRVRAIRVLGRLRHVGVCENLLSRLDDSSATMRVVTVRALGEICDHSVLPGLIKALNDRDALVRATAAEALGRLADSEALSPLVERLSDSSDLVRANALRALGRIGSPQALPHIAGALFDSEPEIQLAAMAGLVAMRVAGALSGSRAVGPIGELRLLARRWPFGRARSDVRRAARQALKQLAVYESKGISSDGGSEPF